MVDYLGKCIFSECVDVKQYKDIVMFQPNFIYYFLTFVLTNIKVALVWKSSDVMDPFACVTEKFCTHLRVMEPQQRSPEVARPYDLCYLHSQIILAKYIKLASSSESTIEKTSGNRP